MQDGINQSILLFQKQCFFFSSKTVFLYRKKKNCQILFVQETTVPFTNEAESKMEAFLKRRKKTFQYNHLFWQKQAVEVADTLFTWWKQTTQ